MDAALEDQLRADEQDEAAKQREPDVPSLPGRERPRQVPTPTGTWVGEQLLVPLDLGKARRLADDPKLVARVHRGEALPGRE